jgi:ATP/maltotriose-dependent transcriptional regulator MalT
LALHQSGDLYRLRGELVLAEQAYREASRHGEEPVPGLALLRLAEGHVEAARAAVARMLIDTESGLPDTAVLAAAVDIFLAAGDVDRARLACDSLARAAEAAPTPLLGAIAAYAAGSVRLADGDPGGALSALRQAEAAWRALEMPYEVARTRVQAARACLALGDAASAELELDAANATFERLGARPDLRITGKLGGHPAGGANGLTGREREVLRLVAAGNTNREIATALHISEHTVARHLQNIYVKLGINSRSSATAYAYEHHLV